MLTSTLANAARDAGVNITMGTPATSLIQEADGSISGAMATNGGGDVFTIRIGATIVAAGSYINNEALRRELKRKYAFLSERLWRNTFLSRRIRQNSKSGTKRCLSMWLR